LDANSALGFQVSFVASGASENFRVTGVQLEAGPVATPFQFEDFGTTLAKCQRYFQRQDTINGVIVGSGAAIATNFALIMFTFPTTMRSAPSLLASGSFNLIGNLTVFFSSAGISASGQSVHSMGFFVSVTGLTSGFAYVMRTSTPSGQLSYNAEL
jgi:hypothetical protein